MFSIKGLPAVPGEFDQVFTTCECLDEIYTDLDFYDYGEIETPWGENSALVPCSVITVGP